MFSITIPELVEETFAFIIPFEAQHQFSTLCIVVKSAVLHYFVLADDGCGGIGREKDGAMKPHVPCLSKASQPYDFDRPSDTSKPERSHFAGNFHDTDCKCRGRDLQGRSPS